MLDTTTPTQQTAGKAERRRGQIDREQHEVVLSGAGKPDAAYALKLLPSEAQVFLALHGLRSVLQAGKDEIVTFQRLRDGRFAPEHARARPRTSLWKEAAAHVLAEERGIPVEHAREQVRHFDRSQIARLRQIAKVAEHHARLSGQQPDSVSQLLAA